MAAIPIANNPHVTSSAKLVTTQEARRCGFLEYALRRNYEALPFLDDAKALKAYIEKHSACCQDIESLRDIQPRLLQAAGISEKAGSHLTDADKSNLLKEFITKVLEPSGAQYIEEIVYRYLLAAGDALGGKMRNITGAIAGEKFTRSVISALKVRGLTHSFIDKDGDLHSGNSFTIEKAADVRAIAWRLERQDRFLVYNLKVPQVKKNIDIVLFGVPLHKVSKKAQVELLGNASSYIAMGELKGGIDPAGADEHWKTANTALERLHIKFGKSLPLFFVGAAIEKAMAKEIFKQCKTNRLANCANLTIDDQLASLAEWLCGL